MISMDKSEKNKGTPEMADDDIIELTDFATNTSSSAAEDEYIVELNDIISEGSELDHEAVLESSDAATDSADEEILDLTEKISEDEIEDEEILDLTEKIAEDEIEDEEILDLTEKITEDETTDEEILDLTDTIAEDETEGEEILDLMDTVILNEAAEPTNHSADSEEILDLMDTVILTQPLETSKPKSTALESDELLDDAEIAELTDDTVEVIRDDEVSNTQSLLNLAEMEADTDTVETVDDGMEIDGEAELSKEELLSISNQMDSIEYAATIELSPEDIALQKKAAQDIFSGEPAVPDKELIELIENTDKKPRMDSMEEEEFALELEEDLLESDEEFEDLGEELDGEPTGNEAGKAFADSLGVDLLSALNVDELKNHAPDESDEGLDKQGLLSIQVQNDRKDGAPVDFKFESRLHPGEKLFREKSLGEETIVVTERELNAALTRVVKEIFADKIDKMLNSVVEKVVAEEIRKIKDSMLND